MVVLGNRALRLSKPYALIHHHHPPQDDEDKICSALGLLSIFDCQSNIDEAERAWRDSLPGGCENEADELRQRQTDELNAHRDLISNPEDDGETVRLQDALTAAEDAVREAQETHLQAAW